MNDKATPVDDPSVSRYTRARFGAALRVKVEGVECEACGAKRGQVCKSAKGGPAAAPHRLRVQAYRHNAPQRLYEALAHGSTAHREWLREAIEAFFAGKEVPPPRA